MTAIQLLSIGRLHALQAAELRPHTMGVAHPGSTCCTGSLPSFLPCVHRRQARSFSHACSPVPLKSHVQTAQLSSPPSNMCSLALLLPAMHRAWATETPFQPRYTMLPHAQEQRDGESRDPSCYSSGTVIRWEPTGLMLGPHRPRGQ